jgi:cyclopropane fatty-acyl-phospholipid synthase-like methyltransferase
MTVNLWDDPDHASGYLERADRIPHRREGEDVLVADLSTCLPGRVLDLGCGDGRLASLVLAAYPESTAVCVDMSPTMLDAAQARFGDDPRVTLVAARLDDRLPVEGPFDAIVSSFAIHHVAHERKESLYAESATLLRPGGVFANLEIVESATPALHAKWRDEMGARDDPSDQLCAIEPQLQWLRAAGFTDVDCIWRWRGLALLRGERS